MKNENDTTPPQDNEPSTTEDWVSAGTVNWDWESLARSFEVKLVAKLHERGIAFDEQKVTAIVSAFFPNIRAINTMVKMYGDPQSEWPDFLDPLK